MKKYFIIIFLLVSYFSFSQKFKNKYLDINNNEITEREFHKQKDYKVNYPIFIQYDSLKTGILVRRKNIGKLDKIELNQLKEYLTKLSNEKINSNKVIVLNYLSSTPITPYFGEKSHWSIFKQDYLRDLNKIPNIQQIWVNNPDNQNLEYFHSDRIKWVEDSDRIIEKLFFPFEFEFGSFVVINSNGNYISYYAEYGKKNVIDFTKECLKLK